MAEKKKEGLDFLTRLRIRELILMGLIVISAVMANLFDHIRTRIDIWIDPFSDPLGSGYQVIQSLIAVGTGGLDGVGLMEDRKSVV